MIGYCLAAFYGVVALLSLVTTYAEGVRQGDDWDWFRVAGLALCLCWPLALAFVLLAAIWRGLIASAPRRLLQERGQSGIRAAE